LIDMADFISPPFYDLFHEDAQKCAASCCRGWREGALPAPRPLEELVSRKVGRHTYSAWSEILDSGEEAMHARYLHRITEGNKLISEEEIVGYGYKPTWKTLQRELEAAGFTQAEGTEGLLAWRLA
jgi:hypothetical protein